MDEKEQQDKAKAQLQPPVLFDPDQNSTLEQTDHAWVDLLLKIADDSETHNPFVNNTTRTLLAKVSTQMFRKGDAIRVDIKPSLCVRDLKVKLAERHMSVKSGLFVVLVGEEIMEDGTTITELLEKANLAKAPIRCWGTASARVENVTHAGSPTPKGSDAELDCSSEKSSSADGCVSSNGYGSFGATTNNAPASMEQLMQMMNAMQHKIASLEEEREKDKVVMSQFETEVSSLRMSMVKVAENPEKIRTILQRVARGFLGRQRCKRIQKTAATHAQRLIRGGIVRRAMKAKAIKATRIQSAWRAIPARRRLSAVLQAVRPLQRIARGWLARKHHALQHRSADVIARGFRYHTSHLRQQYAGVHQALRKERSEKQELESNKILLENKLARLEQQLETQRQQKEKWQEKANSLIEATKCPISHQPMKQPVLCMADGQCYEKASIVEWIRRSGTSPVTRCPVSLHDLVDESPAKLSAYFKTQQWLKFPQPKNVHHICDFKAKRAALVVRERVWSQEFQLDDPNPRHRYSFVMSLHPNGEDGGVGFYIAIRPGPAPERLEWPMRRSIVLTIVNHADTSANKTKTLDAKRTDIDCFDAKAYLEKHAPPASDNTAGRGYSSFISAKHLTHAKANGFISQAGTMTFVAELKPE
jgi:hypothetical protein